MPLADDEVTLGRSKANHIVVADPAVSRQHLTFRVTDNGVVLSAGESIGGTHLNNKAFIGETELQHGDLIALGDSCFQFLVFSKTDAFGNAKDIFRDPEGVARKFGRPKGLADTQGMNVNVPSERKTAPRRSSRPRSSRIPSLAPPDVSQGVGGMPWIWVVLAAVLGGGVVYLLLGG